MQYILGLVTTFFLGFLFTQNIGAQQLEPVAADNFRDLTIPFDSKRIVHFFGPAAAPAGETILIKSKGPLMFNIYREANIFHGGMIRLTAKTRSGTPIGQWEDKILSFNFPSYQKLFNAAPTQESLIELHVLDEAAGGPAQQRPYTVIVEAWPVSENGSLSVEEKKTTKHDVVRTPKVECRLSKNLGPKPEFIETLDSIDRGDSKRPLQLIRLVTAGSLLGVEIPSSWARRSKPVIVNLYAKHAGDQSFMPVCTNLHILPNDLPRMIVGKAPVSDESIWRIEVSAPPNTVIDSSARSLRLLRTKVLATPPAISFSDEWRHGLGFLCFNRRLDRVLEIPAPQSFGATSRLIIDFGEFTAQLTQQQRDELNSVLLQAVYLWVRACVICRLENLIVVTIDNRTYIHPGLYGPGGGFFGSSLFRGNPLIGGKPFTPSVDETENLLRSGLSGGRIGLGPLHPYLEAKKPLHQEFSHICSLNPNAEQHVTLSAVQRTVCQDSNNQGSTATVLVRFKNGETYCGDDPNIIACRADNELTEFNVRDYRFRLAGKSLSQIGHGSVEVDFLHSVMHEMGHWIGMEHVDQGESIMASSLEQSRCIDYDTVAALAKRVYFDLPVESKPLAFTYKKAINK